MKITKSTTLKDLAALVSDALSKAGLNAVLSGGSVVSIYTENEYQSRDLDFVSYETIKDIEPAMATIGFKKTEGRHFKHPDTDFYVEFPPAPLALGNQPVREWEKMRTKRGVIHLLSPTQCVMDRLAGYYAWKDRQNLEQAILVAKRHPVHLKEIETWSEAEGASEEFQIFLKRLKQAKRV